MKRTLIALALVAIALASCSKTEDPSPEITALPPSKPDTAKVKPVDTAFANIHLSVECYKCTVYTPTDTVEVDGSWSAKVPYTGQSRYTIGVFTRSVMPIRASIIYANKYAGFGNSLGGLKEILLLIK